jgi:aldose 1-epimerase
VPLLGLRAGDLALDLAPDSGGIIAGFRHRDTLLMRAPDLAEIAARNPRGGASWPLVPYSNRIRDGRFPWHGRVIELARDHLSGDHAIHGNGWRRPWQVVSADAAHAVLAQRHTPDGFWPFAYHARQDFALTPDGFALTMSVENTGDEAMPAGLGHHPYFRRAADTRLQVGLGEMWDGDAARFPRRRVTVPEAFDFRTARPVDPIDLDAVFVGWTRPARIEWPDAGLALEIAADPLYGRLVVFIPPGRDVFAVEPVSHDTDAMNRAPDADHGLVRLAPGATLAGRMTFRVMPL